MNQQGEKEPELRFPEFSGEWEERKLGELYKERKESGNDNLPILSVSIHHGVSNEELDRDELGKNVRRIEDKSQYKRVRVGDLVFNMMRAWQGAIGVVKFEGMVSPAYITAIPSSQLHPPFMDYRLRRYDAINQIDNASYGVTDFRKRLYWDSFVGISCRIPSVTEQKKITDFFIHLDKLTTLHQRKLTHIQNQKAELLRKMFPQDGETEPQVRFPGFTEAWESYEFNSVFDPIPNNSLSRANLNDVEGKVKNVHYGDILVKYGSVIDCSKDKLPFITGAEASDYSNRLLQNGDILMADAAEDEQVGKATEITGITDIPVVSGLHTIACRPKINVQSCYMGYYLNSSTYRQQLIPLMQGTKVLSISRSNLSRTRVVLPHSEQEQKHIAEILRNIDHLITLHQRKLQHLQDLKKSLLQKMFI